MRFEYKRGRVITAAAALATFAVVAFAMTGCCALIGGGSNNSGPRGIASSGATGTAPGASEPTLPVRPLPLAGKMTPPPRGAYLGVYVPPAPFTITALDSFEVKVRKDAAIVMWYQPWARNNRSRFDSGAVVAIMRRGKVPMITWEPWDPGSSANFVRNPTGQTAYRLSTIIAGKHDAYIRQWAKDIRALGGPVMLRPMHEMNGNWYPWDGTVNGNTPAQFVAAWRHMHDLFEQEGATNVTWVWSINHESVPSGTANRFAAYYPGSRYVDWTAISGFNWGTSSPYSTWRTFSHWYATPLAYLKTLKKPICVAEFGSVEQGGNKGAWLLDAYKQVRATKGVRAIVYYDAVERQARTTQDWRVDTSSASLAAFRKAIAPRYYVGGPPGALSKWESSLSNDDRRYLTLFAPLY